MGFREIFLDNLKKRVITPQIRELNPTKLQAFSRKELETAVQLYIHLKNMGNTFDDLIKLLDTQRETELRQRARTAVQKSIGQTRDERKRLKAGGSIKGRQRRGEV